MIYPGLASHAQHAVAVRQMKAFGGMLSFELAAGLEAANTLASSTRLFTLAESLGGVESLIEIPGEHDPREHSSGKTRVPKVSPTAW